MVIVTGNAEIYLYQQVSVSWIPSSEGIPNIEMGYKKSTMQHLHHSNVQS